MHPPRWLLVHCHGQFLSIGTRLLPPLHDLQAHVDETDFGIAVREGRNRSSCVVHVVLGHCSRLLDAVAFDDELSCL